MNPVDALMDKWCREAECYERDGASVDGGAVLRRCAAELERAAADYGAELLGLRDAAAESGYSADHLGRLVRDGALPNAGKPNAPRIRRCDLPRRPGHGCQPGLVASDGHALRSMKALMARSVVASS